MDTNLVPVCLGCKHYDEFEGGCRAFPTGIPYEISSGEELHKQPLPGQVNNIVYEPIEQ